MGFVDDTVEEGSSHVVFGRFDVLVTSFVDGRLFPGYAKTRSKNNII